MTQLGRHLLDQSILTSDQLREARASKAEYGGRLGTNLVKLGLLELDELAAHLSDATRVPLPPPDWLEAPEPRAARVLPLPLIRRFKLLPLALERSRIHVCMLDPNDPTQLDFVAQAAEREVVPYVLPELRQLYWLERHLGIDRHPRYVNLAARNRRPGLLEETVKPDAEPDSHAAAAASGGLEIRIGDESVTVAARPAATSPDEALQIEDLLADTAPITPESTAGLAAAPPRDAGEVAALEAEIHGATDRHRVAALALRLARRHSRAAALFLVRGGVVASFRGDGGALAEKLPELEVSLLAESLFALPATELAPFRGEPPDDGIDGRLLRVLGRDGVQEVFVHPVQIRGRVVNLLYADNGPDAFGETSVAALAALCGCISRGYERLILARKAGA